MNFCYVFVVHLCGYSFGSLFVLSEARVAGSEGSDMFHDYLVRFCFESEYFESSKGQHLVLVLAVFNGKEIGEELLLGGEGGVSGNPVLGIAHAVNYWFISLLLINAYNHLSSFGLIH